MRGTSSPDDFGNAIEATKIAGRRLVRLVAGNLSPGNFGLLPTQSAHRVNSRQCNHAASGNHLEFRRWQITSRLCTRCSSQTLDVPLVGAAGQFSVGASQCRYGTSRSELGERWPARLVATAAEDRLNIPPTN